MPKWLTGIEAMDHLRLKKSTFYKLVREGKIRAYTLPGLADPRYNVEELDALFTAALVLIPGFAEKVDDGHAIVFAPAINENGWSLTTLPPAGATVGTGAWVPGFRFVSDAAAPPEEQLAAAKQAAKKFLGHEPAE